MDIDGFFVYFKGAERVAAKRIYWYNEIDCGDLPQSRNIACRLQECNGNARCF